MTKNSTNKIPRLRFKGFEGEWEEKRLGDVSEKRVYKNENKSIKNVLTDSAEFGVITQKNFFDKKIANSKNISGYYKVNPNDYIYNPRVSKFAKYGPIRRNKTGIKGIVSPLYYVFNINNNDYNFLDNYFISSKWHKFIYQNGNSGARSDRIAVKDVTFQNMPLILPKINEQQKIGSFFAKLDQLIDLQFKKVEQLKKLKRGYLQKMFPQKGENVPRLRFDGFSCEWEKIHLGNIAILKNGFAGDSSLNDGTYKLTRIETISDKSIDKSKLGFTNEKPKDDYALQKGDILYSNINSVKHIGKTAIFELNDKIYHGINLTRIVVNHNNLKSYFLFYLLNTNYLKIWSMSHANRAVSQASINNNTLRTMPIIYPKLLEQQKILSFILKLDIIISYNHQLLYNIKKMKSAYIQKIYI